MVILRKLYLARWTLIVYKNLNDQPETNYLYVLGKENINVFSSDFFQILNFLMQMFLVWLF